MHEEQIGDNCRNDIYIAERINPMRCWERCYVKYVYINLWRTRLNLLSTVTDELYGLQKKYDLLRAIIRAI